MGLKPLKNPWAIKDGGLVHISSVDPVAYAVDRKKPDFVHRHLCPRQSCGDILFPRAMQTEGKRAHFAHLNLDCDMTHETAIHQVAKAVIMERRYLWLPQLSASPDFPYPVLHPAREMLGYRITAESFVLGRWRADIEMTDHPGPFAIFEEEGEPVLLVEIVVTSPVSPAKIEAVQRAGMKMIAIKLEKEAAESPKLPEMILRTADRQWLAHPAWMEERVAEWDARDRAIETARLVEEARVQDIIERISSGNPPNWEARDAASLDRFIQDHELEPYVGLEVAGAHWMAGNPRWWQATLLKRLYYDLIQIGRDPVVPMIPKGSQCLSAIEGFVIPFREKETDTRLLEAVGVSPREWGTPDKVVDAYLKALAGLKYGRRIKGELKPARRHHDIGYRHHEIGQHLLLMLEGPSGTSEERLFDWKSEGSRIGTRRSLIVSGGRHYEELLEDVAHQAAAARRRRLAPHWYDEEEGGDHDAAVAPVVGREAPPAQPARALSSVREDGPSVHAQTYGTTAQSIAGHAQTTNEPGESSPIDSRDRQRREHQAYLRRQRSANPASAPRSSGTGTGRSSAQARADHELLKSELRKGLVKHYSQNKANSPERSRQLADLFMGSHNPRLGCRPEEHCTTRDRLEICLDLARRK